MKNKTKSRAWHWPYQRINSNGAIEFSCEHGVGHGGIHGCDGCCKTLDYDKKVEELKRSKQTGE